MGVRACRARSRYLSTLSSRLPATTMSSTADSAAQLIYGPNVLHNQSLTTVKFLSSCFAGAVAGILGLENWLGFALFFASTLMTSACIYAINCKGRPTKYLQGGLSELINPGQDNAFTFILVWTLFFGAYFLPARIRFLLDLTQYQI